MMATALAGGAGNVRYHTAGIDDQSKLLQWGTDVNFGRIISGCDQIVV